MNEVETRIQSPEYCMTTALVNSQSREIRLYIEPWGEEYTMPAGATFAVVARGPEEDYLEVVFEDDSVTVWGWTGSVVNVYHDGVQLDAGTGEKPRVPPYPHMQSR